MNKDNVLDLVCEVEKKFDYIKFCSKNKTYNLIINTISSVLIMMDDIKYNFDYDYEIDDTYNILSLIDDIVTISDCIYYIAIIDNPVVNTKTRRINNLVDMSLKHIYKLFKGFSYAYDCN